MSRLRTFLVVALFGSMAFACNRVRVDDVRGPDGNEWKRISCRHMDPRCYNTAHRMCPNGYFMTYADAAGAPVREAPVAVTAEASEEASTSESITPGAAPPPQVGKNAKELPPQNQWSHGMYSWSRGTILVKCADSVARN
jgi:hypothetical protein